MSDSVYTEKTPLYDDTQSLPSFATDKGSINDEHEHDAKEGSLSFLAIDDENLPDFDVDDKNKPVYYEAFFVVMPLFCGYAALFALQKQLKIQMGICDNNSEMSFLFGIAASFLYLGNLIFRVGHNFLFFWTSPRYRVIISMSSMMLAMTILSLIFFWWKADASIVWVFIAYGLGGVAVGSFEANILACLTPLGKETKVYAILAMPVGITSITIGAFLLMLIDWFEKNAGIFYVATGLFVLLGIGIFLIRIFKEAHSQDDNFSVADFFRAFSHWREWLWVIKYNCVALMFDMFFVSLFSPGVELYIYSSEKIDVKPFGTMKTDLFMSIYNLLFFVGDTSSRKLFYNFKQINPFFFLVLSAMGMAIGLSHIPVIVPLCGFLVAFANGSIYAQSTRRIDQRVNHKYNLISLSVWLFTGDIGSVVGSNSITLVSNLFSSGSSSHNICNIS